MTLPPRSPKIRLVFPRSRWMFAATVMVLLAGCNVIPAPTGDPARYYLLSGPALDHGLVDAPVGKLRLGLKVVDLPQYLRGRQMVVRSGANELTMEDYARWAEPLQASLPRLLKAHLIADRTVGRVDTPPFPFDAERDYDVAIDVVRCEGSSQGGRSAARVEAVIEISTAGPNPRVVVRKDFVAPEVPWDGKDFGQLAAGLSAGVRELSREIAAALPAK